MDKKKLKKKDRKLEKEEVQKKLTYALLTEVRYTKQDVDLDVITGEIIHIMKQKKIKEKYI